MKQCCVILLGVYQPGEPGQNYEGCGHSMGVACCEVVLLCSIGGEYMPGGFQTFSREAS